MDPTWAVLLATGLALVLALGLLWSSRVQLGRQRQQTQQAQIEIARLEERQQVEQDRRTWAEQAEQQLRQLTEAILSEQREELAQKGSETFTHTLEPFREQLREFRQRFEQLDTERIKGQTHLQGTIEAMMEHTGKIGTEAQELTQALKGDSRVRGNWGEVTLERVLEISGLQRGREYRIQNTVHRADGDEDRQSLLRPDVILYLPEGRHIVIDAKLTLNSWIELTTAEEDEARERAGKAFLAAVQQQIKLLASKEYHDLPDRQTLDFTFLFVPLESAFQFVLQNRPELLQDALENRIALVSATNLLPLLRVIAHVWRLDQQNRNAQQIAQDAGKMYDKFCGFVDDMEAISTHLNRTQASHGKAMNKLAHGRGNLIGRAQKLKELGAPTSHALPKKFTSEDEPEALPSAPSGDSDGADEGDEPA